MKKKNIMFVGIDPSYNGFGIVVIDKDTTVIGETLLTTSSKDEPEVRLMQLENDFKFIRDIKGLYSVCIEGPSYSSRGAFMLQMGALHFLLRIFLFKNKIKYKVVAPGTLKKFVTGKGNVKKELMLLKTYKKWGVEFEDNNLCDAFGLAQYALEDYKNEH